jgi:histone deacetylase HOS3
VSVLEGGYSDKALLSGAMAHLTGLVDGARIFEKEDTDHSRENWWSPENVQMVRILSYGDEAKLGKADTR